MRTKRNIVAFLLVLFTLISVAPITNSVAAGNVDYDYIRVKLSTNNATTLGFSINGRYFIAENGASFSGGTLTVSKAGSKLRVSHSTSGIIYEGDSVSILRTDMNRSAGYAQLSTNSRKYLGHFYIKLASNGYLQVVNKVPLAHYLYGVVNYEMNNSYPIEALKAQAVAAKCYVFNKMSPRDGYDIGDSSAEQVYKGYDPSATNVFAAVDQTIDVVLKYNGKILYTYYAASNGGETTLPSYAWSSSAVDGAYSLNIDSYDFDNPYSKLETVFVPIGEGNLTSGRLYTMLMDKAREASGLNVTGISAINSASLNTPRHPNTQRNMTRMTLSLTALISNSSDGTDTTQRNITLDFPASDLLDSGVFSNSSLRIYWGENVDGGYNVYHCRWGHGVGLSQRGAQQRANSGHTYRQILSFYFPGAEFATITVNEPENPTPGITPSPSVEPTAPPVNPGDIIARGTVTANGVNFRTGPSTDFSIITVLYRGHKLDILGIENGWYHAVTEDGRIGYILGSFVEITAETPDPTPSPSPSASPAPTVSPSPTPNIPNIIAYGKINANGVNFRVGPGTSYQVITRLNSGEDVYILGANGDWYCAVVQNIVGYVSKQFVEITGRPDDPTPSPEPSPDPGEGLYTAVVTKNGVNFRTGPSTSYQSMGKLSANSGLIIHGKTGDWYYAYSSAFESMGYIHSDYVRITGEYVQLPDGAIGLGLTTGNVNFRTGPSTSYSVIDVIPNGTTITLYGLTSGWYEAEYNGRRGFVSGSYVEITYSSDSSDGDGSEENSEPIGRGVTTGNVNFRTGPSTSSPKITQLPRGTQVTLYSLNNGWYEAEYNGMRGYLYAAYVRIESVPEQDDDAPPSPATGVTTGRLNLRASASMEADIIELLPSGTVMSVLGDCQEWYYVYCNGSTGYVNKAYMQITASGTIGIAPVDGNQGIRAANCSAKVNLRTGPGTSYGIIRLLPAGTSVEYFYTLSGWCLIRHNGDWGFAIIDYLEV